MNKSKKTFWLSYDLGLKGDYHGMYEWLDNYKARECGESLAVFKFSCGKNFIQEVQNDLKNYVEFKNGDRVYLIYRDDQDNYTIKGRFIIGKRKPAPWEGYSLGEEDMTIDF